MKQALIALVLAVVLAVVVTPASGARSSYWDRLAACETHSAWSGLGQTYQGGLGIWYGNWDRWAGRLGLGDRYPDADDAPRAVQIQVANWAYYNDRPRPYWGCFATIGYPA
jgi:hypothetical protein